ncbi:3-hydroxyacyl-ACP dehydratase FabZ [Candidatus Cytomitobacter indipagum]|uniref:3-hydroxyacyl-ACP dehydratase FabZ n=1 Tax=Candidatus Cytomitobacter indipagum TaxID=2601575 RepID=UPI00155A9D3C|nr:3-hydroxyacyl-ACP dehydratase FabZ [Candidatus Cytomitobacter indipagum]
MILLNIDQIKALIPHRDPFLFLDRVQEVELWKSAIGYRTFSSSENFFVGHFPDYHVVPGVILIEAMAQLATLCVAYSYEKEGQKKPSGVAFMSIDQAKFRKPVEENDTVKFIVNQEKGRGSIFQFTGTGFIDDTKVCEAKFMAMSKK